MKKQIKTLSLCALAMGILFAVLGLNASSQRKNLEVNGVSAPGKIVHAEVQPGSKGKKRYVIHVDWTQGENKHVAQRFVVKKAFFDTKVEDRSQVVVPDVTVRYLPDKPGSEVIDGGSGDFSGMEWLGLIVGLLGLFGTWKSFFAKPAAARAA